MDQYINLNGQYLDAKEPVFSAGNRGFRYGDALYEVMHANGTTLQFFQDHMERLIKNMNYLNMEIPPPISNHRIQQEIVKLLNKNKHLKGAKARVTVFRNGGGQYTPNTNSCSYFIESEKLETDIYTLNKKGLIVDVFQNLKKPITPLSNLNSTDALFYILAGNFKREHDLDDCLLVNQNNEIIEAPGSNIFLVRKNVVKTPPLKSGCKEGIIRKHIFDFAHHLGYKMSRQHPVSFEDLTDADEMFLTNSIDGIQWVGGIRQKRYFKNTAKKMANLLNEKTRID
ncbi:MAG: aminotransferase class IV [Bacteroidales bacterium]|nr:aminotransferase class IV family protein [Bacteroidales bacterium]